MRDERLMGRVWEPFLTEQDRLSIAASVDQRVGFGARPALLLVDLYRWVFGDKPEPILDAMRTWPGTCGLAAWAALPRIQILLKAARQAGVPIVHLTGMSDSGSANWYDAIHAKRQRQEEVATAADDRLERKYAILEEVAPLVGEAVFRKSAPSGFCGTPLLGHLTNLSVDTLLVAGETTSGCVRATVVDGASYRFRVTVVEECVFDRHEATHALNLFDMHMKYADVRALGDVLERLEGYVER